MAYIIEIANPLEPLNALKHIHPGGITIRQWLETRFPEFIEFPVPTICIIDGQPILRKEWGVRIIQPGDVVNFVTVPGGWELILAVVIVAVVAALTLLLVQVPKPVTPGQDPTSAPVFSIKGQQNQIRLGEPIESTYGRCRVFPSLAARPYFQYLNNDQFQYVLLCIGQGHYDINEVKIGDTNIGLFAEAQYEIIPPGGTVTLFPINVITSAEVGGIDLFAPNEPEYIAPGWVGPFIANPEGTQASQIQVDLIFSKGLYSMDENGNIQTVNITTEIEMQPVDDIGVPIGSWTPLAGGPVTFGGATTTPQRWTVAGPTPAPQRYQVRMRRTSDKDLSVRAGNDETWEGLRAYVDDLTMNFGDVTLLAVRIRATNNLNEKTQLAFNVIVTRRLPAIIDGVYTTSTYPTRSIVWAFMDIFRARYGGRIVDDVFFDFDHLSEMDAIFLERGDFFDWSFRDPITVWEAARTVARVGRTVPLLQGSLITMVRDAPLDIPVTFFSPENMLPKTFKYSVKFWDFDEYDSVAIEYTDPDTGYKQETVIAALPGGTVDHPQDIRFAGIGNRAQAFREGMYIMAVNRYIRENISFETGLEGYIPTFGDLVAVSHDMTKWGQWGYLVNAEKELGDFTTWQLWLSEPLVWDTPLESDYQLLLRGRKAEVIGPLNVRKTSDPKQIFVDIPEGNILDFQLDGTTEPMLFLFGRAGAVTKMAKVVSIEPSGGETIRITTVNYTPVIYSYDSLPVPPLGYTIIPTVPDLPVIPFLNLTLLDPVLQVVQAFWGAAPGAQYYVVQYSRDGTNWTNLSTTTQTSLQMQLYRGNIHVRVAGVNNGQGPWIEEEIDLHLLHLDLIQPWEVRTLYGGFYYATDGGEQWGVGWNRVLNASGYRVEVYDNSGSEPVLKRTEDILGTTFYYDLTKATSDGNLNRLMLVKVDVLFGGFPANDPAEIELVNDLPIGPISVAGGVDTASPTLITWHVTWDVLSLAYPNGDLLYLISDIVKIKVWSSETGGFDPDDTNLVQEIDIPPGIDPLYTGVGSPIVGFPTSSDPVDYVPPLSDGTMPRQYYRIGFFDAWGNEISTNVSGEHWIEAYP